MPQPAHSPRHLVLESTGIAGQAPPVAAEHMESPIFSQLIREQADLFRGGHIGVDNFGDFMEAANSVSRTDYGESEEYTDPNGKVLTAEDADNASLLYAASTPDFWTLGRTMPPGQRIGRAEGPTDGEGPSQEEPLTYEQLSVVAKVFEGYGSVPNDELEGSEETLRQLQIARQRTANTLGVTEPENRSLEELRAAIERRQQLSDAIVTDRAFREQHFLPVVIRRYNAAHGIAEPEGGPEPATVPASAQTTMVISRPMQARPSGPAASEHPVPVDSTARRIRSHRRDPKSDPEHIANRHHLWRTIGTTVLSVAVTTALRTAEVVPGGAVIAGATIGAVGMTLGTLTNRRFWAEKGGRRKLAKLALAIGGGAALGAGVALGTTLLMDVIPDAIDGLHDLFSGDATAATPDVPVTTPDPTVPPDPTPPPLPPTPAAFDAPLQTEQLGGYTGADGADNNPWTDGTGVDATADRIDAEVLRATGHQIDWSTIDPQDFHNFVGEVLDDNGRTWADMTSAADTDSLVIDPQKALDFLASQSIPVKPILTGAGV